MTTRILPIIAATSLVALFAACSTTPEGGDKPAAKPDAAAAPAPDARGRAAPTVDLTNRGGGALKDPNSILSKRSIYFDYDKYEIKDEFKSLVEAHAKYLRENPNARMLIQGNTEERGSREYNVGLGQRRSDGVKRMLTLLGARESQVESVSLGEEKPQDAGHSESAWSKNRRSDILYSGEY